MTKAWTSSRAHFVILDKRMQISKSNRCRQSYKSRPKTQRDLWELVTTNMIHGPCGIIVQKKKTGETTNLPHCCVNGTCDHFPKELRSETFITQDSYPEYRRRSKKDGGFTFYDKIAIYLTKFRKHVFSEPLTFSESSLGKI